MSPIDAPLEMVACVNRVSLPPSDAENQPLRSELAKQLEHAQEEEKERTLKMCRCFWLALESQQVNEQQQIHGQTSSALVISAGAAVSLGASRPGLLQDAHAINNPSLHTKVPSFQRNQGLV